MQSNYPRIYSLSTIGIKQHFNADYIFHPYRTDFSGESGSGKSMVADMIQLVLVGSSEFKSATDGNKNRDVKGMLISSKGNTTSRGYIFLNIEVSPKKYLVIGVYIEGTSNAADMFIIQNGYDWDNLTFLTKPVTYSQLIIDNKVDILKNLSAKVDFARMKPFKRRDYHKILYDNEILSLNLTKSETLRTYANILRSFSRGKGFKIESENLKKFLFGDDEQNAIIEKYNEEVNNISNDFQEHKRYTEEIELINEKQDLIKTALQKQKDYKTIYTEYLTKKFNYWNTFKKKVLTVKNEDEAKLRRLKNELQFVEIEMLKLQLNDLEELLSIKKKVKKLIKINSSETDVERRFIEIGQRQNQVNVVESWLESNNDDIGRVKSWFATQRTSNLNKSALIDFTQYLQENDLKDAFELSGWAKNYKEEKKAYPKQVKKLENEIAELESLSRFSDLNNPESLVNWALDNLTFPLSPNIESVLVYFQKYGLTKPSREDPNRYVAIPNNLFKKLGAKIKDEEDNGFWLNLDGVYEYISYSENQVLNIKDPNELIKSISKLKEGVDEKLSKVKAERDNLIHLKNVLHEFGNLQKHIELYKERDQLTEFQIDNSLSDINEKTFKTYLESYNSRTDINKQYGVLQKEYHEFANRKTLLEDYNRKTSELQSIYFEGDDTIDGQKIENHIGREQNTIKQKEALLDATDFDKESFVKKHSKDIINQHKLSDFNHSMSGTIADLERTIQQKKEQVGLSLAQIQEAIDLNDELFRSQIEFDNDASESVDPESGGETSLQYKANQAKQSYTEYLKLITKDLPYDETASVGQLAHYLLPTVFLSTKVDEDLIENDIVDRLNKLTQDIKEIGSRKVEILGSIFNEVYRVYSKYLTKINEIDKYLKKGNAAITGGNKASLTFKKSIHYPEKWLSTFRKQLNNQLSYTGLFSDLKEEIDINKMMMKGFQKLGGSTKVEPEDLMNPKSYFDLIFELKLENEEVNSGSHGQTYAANALLCLARLSLIEEGSKTGLKIMPIDEAEGLGSNYTMLHELAKKEKYQIITMAIETAGEITENDQYIYILNDNNLADTESFVPPFAIFSDEVTEDINQYIKALSDNE